ncbi:MAG TPA: hypothetical protein VER97_16215 [Geodermatophilus sp.]|nr:hypothetical protein [Geodermatophilus sp.]
MPDPQLGSDDLRRRRWREDLHEQITPPRTAVDPLAEAAADSVGRRRAEAMTSERLPLDLVAEVVNRLDAADLPDPARLLLRQPGLLVVALEGAYSEGTPDADDPVTDVVDRVTSFVDDRAYPDFVHELVDLALQRELLVPVARERGLEGGDVPREELVRRLLAEGVDMREGRCLPSLEQALEDVTGGTGGDEARDRTAGTAAGTATGTAAGTAAGGRRERPAADGARPTRPPSTGSQPPVLWGMDCALDVPVDIVASTPRVGLLALAPTIAFLYQFGERQPLFAAMDALRERALGGDLLNPLAVPEAAGDDPDATDELCDLRMLAYSWNTDVDPLTPRRRADVAAVIGVRDPAGTTEVNTRFARTADQLVDVLATTATDRCGYHPEAARAVAAELSLQLAGSFQTALTGQVLVDLALWRRQFTFAWRMLGSRALRDLLGVGPDPDHSPAPAIRRLLPPARFDAASLHREWQALDLVLGLARHLAAGQRVGDGEFAAAAAAAVTLRALRGRAGVLPGRPTSR